MAIWVRSPNFHPGRRDPMRWIVWHSTESSEVKGGAHNVAAGWFAKPESRVSAHVVVDDGSDPRYPDGVVECVRPGDTAWHAASANAGGYGIEIVGKAGQGSTAWSDPYSLAAVRNACRWVKSNPSLRDVPAKWLTDSQLRSRLPGHIVHSQVSRVLGGTSHTDPGTGFPYAYVMEQLGTPTPTAVPRRTTLRLGYSGDMVSALQRALNATFPDYSRLTVDGDFGPKTSDVVEEFQGRAGLVKDGVVGPATWAALARFGI